MYVPWKKISLRDVARVMLGITLIKMFQGFVSQSVMSQKKNSLKLDCFLVRKFSGSFCYNYKLLWWIIKP